MVIFHSYVSLQEHPTRGIFYVLINHHSPCLSSLFQEAPASWNVVDTGAEVSMEEKVWPWSGRKWSSVTTWRFIPVIDWFSRHGDRLDTLFVRYLGMHLPDLA